jgi:hypothetical protein
MVRVRVGGNGVLLFSLGPETTRDVLEPSVTANETDADVCYMYTSKKFIPFSTQSSITKHVFIICSSRILSNQKTRNTIEPRPFHHRVHSE